MTLHDYFESMRGKTAAVIGLGVSNQPLLSLLVKSCAHVIACDRKERDSFDVSEFERMGIELHLGQHYLDNLCADVIFRTPGIRPDVSQLLQAIKNGAEITSEMEVFFSVCPCPIIAVTGSDGKTTTTSILAELFRSAGKTVWLGGNIGHPLLSDAAKMMPNDVAVVELSSFQLLTMRRSPHIAVVTNLSPNHLDWHVGMNEYIAAKKNIFLHQTRNDILVLNADNDVSMALRHEAVGTVRFFSRKRQTENGTFFKNGVIYLSDDGNITPVIAADKILLPGLHNVENFMAAFSAAKSLVSIETMHHVAQTFSGVAHRCEPVREYRGVKWYNDSIASTPTRTIAGLHSFDRQVILIAGGYDKHIPFDALGPEIAAHAKALILCGATAEAIEQAVVSCESYRAAREKPAIIRCSSLTEAVSAADACAVCGDIVTLSPACAAFDQFANFEVRGNTFKELVFALGE